jgi:hypothetical protein
MPAESRDAVIAKFYCNLVPELETEWHGLAQASVHVGTWLVGLATGLIALLVGIGDARSLVGTTTLQWAIGLLSVVVVLGVVQRALFHLAQRLRWPILVGLRGNLLGYTDRSAYASELSQYWDKDEIVRRLRDDLGMDYDWLLEPPISLERARDAYNSHLAIHKKYEDEGLAHLAQLMTAHTGMPAEAEANYFSSKPEDIPQIRRKAMRVNQLFFAAEVAYAGAALCFVAAVIVTSIAVIIGL